MLIILSITYVKISRLFKYLVCQNIERVESIFQNSKLGSTWFTNHFNLQIRKFQWKKTEKTDSYA